MTANDSNMKYIFKSMLDIFVLLSFDRIPSARVVTLSVDLLSPDILFIECVYHMYLEQNEQNNTTNLTFIDLFLLKLQNSI